MAHSERLHTLVQPVQCCELELQSMLGGVIEQRRVPLAFASPYQANFRMHHTII